MMRIAPRHFINPARADVCGAGTIVGQAMLGRRALGTPGSSCTVTQ